MNSTQSRQTSHFRVLSDALGALWAHPGAPVSYGFAPNDIRLIRVSLAAVCLIGGESELGQALNFSDLAELQS
jgi:hypothetical protein